MRFHQLQNGVRVPRQGGGILRGLGGGGIGSVAQCRDTAKHFAGLNQTHELLIAVGGELRQFDLARHEDVKQVGGIALMKKERVAFDLARPRERIDFCEVCCAEVVK